MSSPHKPNNIRTLLKTSLGAVGVVYGDIGTSPLYALKECFLHGGNNSLALNELNIFGILSLVFWSLALVVIFKYITFVMRADNEGEGGILSLLALATPNNGNSRGKKNLIYLGLFGAALLYGDGVITPVVSAYGAVEGLKVRFPSLEYLIMPLTALILVFLFLFQKKGTAKVGALFGPLMMLWFASIALIGLIWILKAPQILKALNPAYAIQFLIHHKLHGFLILSAVVLCVTGAEALYADMGHFGKGPIRLAWYAVVFPSLLLNYFGQGAFLLTLGKIENKQAFNPFFQIVPELLQLPMVFIATAAAIIASQALISGAYSLTRQAMQLGYWPRMSIIHTDHDTEGQIYVPEINWLLMIGCLGLVIAFRKEGSSGLAAAYGIAVTGTMAITSILYAIVARQHEEFRWPLYKVVGIVTLFLIVDVVFFSANLAKIADGGWIPLAIATFVFSIMLTWKKGREKLKEITIQEGTPLQQFAKGWKSMPQLRVPGTAVCMSSNEDHVPRAFLHHIRNDKSLHAQFALVKVLVERRHPIVDDSKRLVVKPYIDGYVYQVIIHTGYMQATNVPELLEGCTAYGLDTSDVSYYLGSETIVPSCTSVLGRMQVALFALLMRNATSARSTFGIKPNRTTEVGVETEIDWDKEARPEAIAA